jgi:hypothetical protein
MALTRLGLNQSINLSSNTTGTLGVANGGTGLTSGTTDQFLKFTGSTTLASAADNAGINMFDTWYTTSTQTHSSGEHRLQNWSRMSNESAKKMTNIGSAMSQSGGEWTFPSTGKYWIMLKTYTSGSATTNYCGVLLKNANNVALNQSYTNRQSLSTLHNMCMVMTFLDVTDTTDDNCKVRFNTNQGATSLWISGGDMETQAFFMRIGDT